MSTDDLTPLDGVHVDPDFWAQSTARVRAMEWANHREGCSYIWGGKGEELPASEWTRLGLEVPLVREVFDCSGFVTCAMHYLGLNDWRLTHSADRIFHLLEPTNDPDPMDMAFYGQPSHINHVMFVWEAGKVMGAGGGNSGTHTLDTAHRVGAKVRVRSNHLYRPDFRGWRKLPLPKET